jgi:hypothetical protein
MAKQARPTSKSSAKRSPAQMASTSARGDDANGVPGAVRTAISSGEIISVGVLNLVKNTLIAALGGARDVGGELGSTAITVVRGSIKAAHAIGGDLGTVVKHAIKGTIEAAEEIGGELGGAARSAARGAVRATGEVGGDVSTAARKAMEGSAEAARDLGADVNLLVRNAAQGALEAAERIGSAATRAVRATVSEAVAGFKSLAGSSAGPSRGASSSSRGHRPAGVSRETTEDTGEGGGRHRAEAGARRRAPRRPRASSGEAAPGLRTTSRMPDVIAGGPVRPGKPDVGAEQGVGASGRARSERLSRRRS